MENIDIMWIASHFLPLSELLFDDLVGDGEDEDEKSEVRGRRKNSLKPRLCLPVMVMMGSSSPMVWCCSMSTDEYILLVPEVVAESVAVANTPFSGGFPDSIFSFRNSIEEQALPARSSPLGSAEMEDLW